MYLIVPTRCVSALTVAGLALGCSYPAPAPQGTDALTVRDSVLPNIAVQQVAGFDWVSGGTEVVRARSRVDPASGSVVVEAQLPLPVLCRIVTGKVDTERRDTLFVTLSAAMPQGPPGTQIGCAQMAGTKHVRAVLRPVPRGRSWVILRYTVPNDAAPPQMDTVLDLGPVSVP